MRCEICGRTIQGKPYRIIVEQAKLIVCGECVKHGSQTWKPPQKPQPKISLKSLSPKTIPPPIDEGLMLIENYGFKIKTAREKRGWTQEELASKIGEKTSFISKIETEKVSPSICVAKKIEHVLGVTLLTRELASPTTQQILKQAKHESADLTIGDLIMLNKETRKGEKSESRSS